MRAASAGGLKTAAGLEAQVRRMLADPRSEALATRFAPQWLRLQDLDKIRPDALLFPYWDHTLAETMRPRDRAASSTASCATIAACSTC